MSHIQGTDRQQMTVSCLEDQVDSEHIVRVVDAFVSIVDVVELGIAADKGIHAGRPSFDPKTLLALFLFGTLESVRSSRRLERMAKESLPAIWLLGGLAPDYRTIAAFRKANTKAIEKLFDEFGSFLSSTGLFGKAIYAIDGTTVRASNSKKRNFSKKSLKKRKEALTEKLKENLHTLEEADTLEAISATSEKVEKCEASLSRVEKRLETIEEQQGEELSETDKDARLMHAKTGGVGVGYNMQAAVDGKNNLVISYDVVNEAADTGQLFPMAQKATEALRKKEGLLGLADKGYYGSKQIGECEEQGLEVLVACQHSCGDKDTPERYWLSAFEYDEKLDSYICPSGKHLHATSSKDAKRRRFSNKDACLSCAHAKLCVTAKARWRTINRGAGTDVLERARKRFKENKDLYRLRQQIVEPVFGHIKTSMNFSCFLLRGLEGVRAEAALVFLGYNVKRSLGALGFEGMMRALKEYGAWLAKTKATSVLSDAFLSPFGAAKALQQASWRFLAPQGQRSWPVRGVVQNWRLAQCRRAAA
jgi:transposase